MHAHGFGMAFVFLFLLATFDPVEDSAWYSAAKPTGRKALLGQALHRPLGMECIWHFACETLMALLDLAELGDQMSVKGVQGSHSYNPNPTHEMCDHTREGSTASEHT